MALGSISKLSLGSDTQGKAVEPPVKMDGGVQKVKLSMYLDSSESEASRG